MKNFIKICLIHFLLWTVNMQSILAEEKMNNQQVQIIKNLKKQGVVPNKVYFQHDFLLFLHNEDSFPDEELFASVSGLENNSMMHYMAIQDISQIKLNENYQYSDILQRRRNIIEILYPSDAFQSLDDGVHFFTLDEHKQLQKKNSFKDVFDLPCYLRVEKKHGIVVSIQKRPLASVSHYIYDYWTNNSIKHLSIKMYDTEHNTIYSAEAFFNNNGAMVKQIRKNPKTGNSSIETILKQDGIYSIEEFFDNYGIKTNHVIHYEKSMRVKNQVLNKEGKVTKTKNREPILFDFEKDLDETYPYNKLIMNIEKSNALLTDSIFEQVIGNSNKYDSEATNRVKYLNITPNQVYYHKLPFPGFMAERYKNFPHQAPLTLIEAENQSPFNKYSDLIKVEIGDNYQYKKISKTKWQQSTISLPIEQFKSLENDIYFFTMDDKGQLNALDSVEHAVNLPSYIRVEKVMGKIVSIMQKRRVQWTSTEFEYKGTTPISSKFNVIESHLVPNLVMDTLYEIDNYLPLSQVIKNAQGTKIRTFLRSKKENSYAILEKFNDQGIKTNHIKISNEGDIENQYLDNQGKVLFCTDELEDRNDPKLYDNLPINPDGFEIILSEHFS